MLGAPVISNVRKAAGEHALRHRPGLQKALTSLSYSVLGESSSVHAIYCRPFKFGNVELR